MATNFNLSIGEQVKITLKDEENMVIEGVVFCYEKKQDLVVLGMNNFKVILPIHLLKC